ncbi:hypothetical protein HU734_013150 [Pseudomonas wayambapalatensis]|nr:hypothetical protein HU734_013150 [Pseudomonas wayambapalatensis]
MTSDQAARRSAALKFTVTVSDDLELNAVKIPAAPNNVLDPLNAANGADALVEYDMQPEDSIVLLYNGRSYPAQNGNTSNRVVFRILSDHIISSINSTVSVSYQVTRRGKTLGSAELQLQVLNPTADRLPVPAIAEAVGGRLDVINLRADANVSVAAWPLQTLGQLIYLRYSGTCANGSQWTQQVWNGKPLDQLGAVRSTIALSTLGELLGGSRITLRFEVSFDQGRSRVVFRENAYEIIQGPSVIRDDFSSYAYNHEVRPGGVLPMLGGNMCRVISGKNIIILTAQSDWPLLRGNYLRMNEATVRFELNGTFRTFRCNFTLGVQNSTTAYITYLNAQGATIETRTVTLGANGQDEYSFTSSARDIKVIQIQDTAGLNLDDFEVSA